MEMQYKMGKVGLKPFDKEDLIHSNYKNWLNNINVNKYMYRGKFPLTDNNIQDIFDSIDRKEKIEWAIYYLEEKNICVHVGNISLENIDFINSSAEIIIVLGEVDFWGKGIGTIAWEMAIRHGFKKLKLHRLYAGTHENNKGMIKNAGQNLIPFSFIPDQSAFKGYRFTYYYRNIH